MENRWLAFAATQVWQVPLLVAYIIGVVYALNRQGQGKFATYAALGFGLLAVTWALQSLQQYLFYSMMERRDLLATMNMPISLVIVLAKLGGILLVIAAVFANRPRPA